MKRNEIRGREGEGRERKREEQVKFPLCLSTSIKGHFCWLSNHFSYIRSSGRPVSRLEDHLYRKISGNY